MKFCVVGCGKQSEKYVDALTKLGEHTFVAIDVDEANRSVFADRFGCEQAPDLSAALNEHSFDGAMICTPVSTHEEYSRVFADAKIPFICEKPLAETAAQARVLADLVKQADVAAGVTYTYRYAPAFRHIKSILEAEDCPIGAPRTAVFRVGGRGNHRVWKHMRPHGGVTNELLSHMLDLAYWLVGDFESLKLVDQRQLQSHRTIDGTSIATDAEDYSVVVGTTRTGVNCTFVSDFVTPSFVQYAEIQGENGTLFGSIQPFYRSGMMLNAPMGGVDRGQHFFDLQGPGPVAAIAQELQANAAGGGNFTCSLEDACVSQTYLDDIISQLRF